MFPTLARKRWAHEAGARGSCSAAPAACSSEHSCYIYRLILGGESASLHQEHRQVRRQRCVLSAGQLSYQPNSFAKIILFPAIYYNRSTTVASLKSLLTNELPLKFSNCMRGGEGMIKPLFF